MRIITVCEGGTVRSVAMARVLKEGSGDWKAHDAIALSTMGNTAETFALMSGWADKIIVMADYIKPPIPDEHRHKLIICDVGKDVYQTPFHGVLLAKCKAFVKEMGL